MLSGLGKFWSDLMTDGGGFYCPVRIFGSGLISTHVGATIAQTVMHGTFDAVAFGTGSAALIAGVGAAIGAKSKLGGDA